MTIDVLIVGAGGDGGHPGPEPSTGGGGGGGQVVIASQSFTSGSLTVTVGQANPGGAQPPSNPSSVTGFPVAAGGVYGRYGSTAAGGGGQGGAGGDAGAYVGGAPVPGLSSSGGGASWYAHGGAPTGANGGMGGNGANGVVADHSGVATWYGSGGGGGGRVYAGIGGAGAGNGATHLGAGTVATAPTNYGCGGGGAAWYDSYNPENPNPHGHFRTNGFQGVVIIRYAGVPQASGGTITSSGGNTIHTFTTNGTFTYVAPPVPAISYIAPASGARGTTPYIDVVGSNFVVGATTINLYSNGPPITLAGGPYWGHTGHLACHLTIPADAYLGVNHLIGVTTAGGFSGWIGFDVQQLPPTLGSIAPTSGWRGTTVYVDLYGSNFLNGGTTVNISTNGGVALASGVIFGSASNIAVYLSIAANAALGAAHWLSVTTVGGSSGWVGFTVAQRPPTISSIDNASGIQGQNPVPINIYGSEMCADGFSTTISGDGISISGGPWQGSLGHWGVHFAIAPTATPGARTLTVSTVGGTSNGVGFTVLHAPPTITAIDNTQLPGEYDTTFVQGTTNVYTHFWGTYLTNPTSGTVSGTGVTVSFAAYGNPNIIALYLHVASNAALGARTVTVTTPGGTSNALTITITPAVPTLTSITPTQAVTDRTTLVSLTGTFFVTGGTTVNVSGTGITVTGVTVSGQNQLACELVIAAGAALGARTVTVTTVGGTSGAVTFTVSLQPAAIASGGMIVTQTAGSLITVQTGNAGFFFNVKSTPRQVTALGRFRNSGNTQRHTVFLRDMAGHVAASAEVDLSEGPVGQWRYTEIPAVTLQPNQTYALLSSEDRAGDTFLGETTLVYPDAYATVLGPAFEQPLFYNFTPGTIRTVSDGVYQCGCRFTTGALCPRVVALGIWKRTGNSKPRPIFLRLAVSPYTVVAKAVVDFSAGAGRNEEMVYTTIDPLTLKANTTYDLVSTDVLGETHYDWNTVLQPSGESGITINQAVAVTVSDNIPHLDWGTTNNSFVPVGFLYSVVKNDATWLAQNEAFISSVTPSATIRNELTYALGYKFTMQYDRVVKALGRWKLAGNTRAHTILLKDAAGTILRSAVVDYSTGAGRDNAFCYAPIQPITLTQGASYYLLSCEDLGGDMWLSGDSVVTPRLYVADVNGNAYQDHHGAGIPANVSGTPNLAYVVPNFLWQSGETPTPNAFGTPNLQWRAPLNAGEALVIDQQEGTPRSEDIGELGFRFLVKSTPRQVTALGRWKLPGNSRRHTVTLRDSAEHIIVAAVIDMSRGHVGYWVYSEVTPVTLVPHQGYRLVSDEDGLDSWLNDDTTIVTDQYAIADGAQTGVDTSPLIVTIVPDDEPANNFTGGVGCYFQIG